MNRVLAVARLHLFHPLVGFGVPWAIALFSFAINWSVWRLADVGAQPGSGNFTGGVLSLYVTLAVVYAQAVTQMLPFAMGVSSSRRTFYLGTALVGVAEALGYGVALSALASIEGATDGWGVGLHFWAPTFVDVDDFFLQIAVSGAPMLAFIAIGAGVGVVHKRWGANGVWALTLGTLVVLGALAVLATAVDAWVPIGTWFADRSVVTNTVALPAVLALLAAALTWGGLRRAVP
ncbi:hypothetical protein [Geodermatophilus sp. SYSU D00815]